MRTFAYLDEGFKNYLKQIVDSGHLKKVSRNVSFDITKILLENGFESLSAKQVLVFFEHVVGKLIIDKHRFSRGFNRQIHINFL
jgi:hypothetical protein